MRQPSEPGVTFLHSVRDAVLSALVSGRGRTIGTVLLAVFLLVSFLPTQPLITGLQYALFDGYQRLAPRIPSSAPAVIIAIDQKSLDQLGQWPWPRTVMADLIQALGKIGPAAIGVDVLFPEPDRMSAANVARAVERLDPEIARRLKKLPDNDSILAAALRDNGEVVRLIESGEDVNGASVVRPLILSGRALVVTPIEAAVAAERADMVELLLEQGARMDAALWTRLMCFSVSVEADDVRALLEPRRPEASVEDCDGVEIGW